MESFKIVISRREIEFKLNTIYTILLPNYGSTSTYQWWPYNLNFEPTRKKQIFKTKINGLILYKIEYVKSTGNFKFLLLNNETLKEEDLISIHGHTEFDISDTIFHHILLSLFEMSYLDSEKVINIQLDKLNSCVENLNSWYERRKSNLNNYLISDEDIDNLPIIEENNLEYYCRVTCESHGHNPLQEPYFIRDSKKKSIYKIKLLSSNLTSIKFNIIDRYRLNKYMSEESIFSLPISDYFKSDIFKNPKEIQIIENKKVYEKLDFLQSTYEHKLEMLVRSKNSLKILPSEKP